MNLPYKKTSDTPNYFLFLSALFGCVIAVGQRAEWQAPIESAQVQAGLVVYPPDAPLHYFHLKSWSLLNQIAATILSLGGSEASASIYLGGLVGAISFAGVFLITYSVCRDNKISLLMPLLMYSLSLMGVYVAYPIALLGTDSSYGILGLSYILLSIGLLGSGYQRSGSFITGLAPTIHPTMGIFGLIITVISIFFISREQKLHWHRLIIFFLLGLSVTAISIGWQLHLTTPPPGISTELKKMYLEAFIRNLDYHRNAGGWTQTGTLLGVIITGLSALVLRMENAPIGAKLIATSIIVSVILSMFFVILSNQIPFFYFLKIIIPWRFMNYANICIIPVSFALLAAEFMPAPRLRASLFTAILFSLIFLRLAGLSFETTFYYSMLAGLIWITFLNPHDLPKNPFHFCKQWQGIIVFTISAIFIYRQVIPGLMALPTRKSTLYERTNTTLLRTVGSRPGILLTAGNMHLVQLVTRRPVLLDGGALDIFPYILETGPRFNEILKKVYGLDMFTTPPPTARQSGVASYHHKELWEKKSCTEWKQIRREFGVTDVLTPIDWNLQLTKIMTQKGISDIMTPFYWGKTPPYVDQNSGMALYSIPDKNDLSCQ